MRGQRYDTPSDGANRMAARLAEVLGEPRDRSPRCAFALGNQGVHRLPDPIGPRDRLPAVPGEPDGCHTRERTEDGYWLMGSSPAERADGEARMAEAKRQAMRDHPFEGDGPYCRAWNPIRTSGGDRTGILTLQSTCGYPRDTHPDQARGTD